MPKAFTFLCEKINLSLYNDTLTVYPKSKPKPQMFIPVVRGDLSLVMALLFSEMNCMSARVENFFVMQRYALGIYRFVRREDSDHEAYHQDEFSKEEIHYHAQFEAVIDEIKLENILTILERHALITSKEHGAFIDAYHQANTLSPSSDLLISKEPGVKEEAKDEPSEIRGTTMLPVNKETNDKAFVLSTFSGGFFPAKSLPACESEAKKKHTYGMENTQ